MVAAGFAITAIVAQRARVRADTEARGSFDAVCREIQVKIEDRLDHHRQILRSAAAYFALDAHVSRSDWRAYCERQKISRTQPGSYGLGYAAVVPKAQLAAYVASIQADGMPDFHVWPAGDREIYTTIPYLEPQEGRNLRVFGYDMATEPVRRAAMEATRDGDTSTLSGRLQLVQETGEDVQAGTIMYMAVYRKGRPIATVEERRAALQGWVYSPYRMNDMVAGILGPSGAALLQHLRLEIFDGTEARPAALLYDSQRDHPGKAASSSVLERSSAMEFAHRKWLLQFTQHGDAPGANYGEFWLTTIGGSIGSVLLAGLVLSLTNTRARARAIADGLTSDLRHSEERWKFALEGSGDGIWDWDTSKTYASLSRRWKEMLGYRDGDFGTEFNDWTTLIHPEDKPRVLAAATAHLLGQSPGYACEYRMHCRDGSWKWILARGLVVSRDAKGQALRMIGTHADISERKQAELVLRESEERHRRILATAMDGFWRVDRQGNFLEANEAYGRIVGYTPDELLKMNIADVEALESPAQVAARIQTIVRDGEARFESQHRRKDGTIADVQVSVKHWPGEGGQMIAFIQDISARKQAERARDEVHDRLQKLASRLPGVVYQFLMRPDGTFAFPYASEGLRELYGIAPEDVTADGAKVFSVVHPDDLAALQASILASARDLSAWHHEFRVRRLDGTERWLRGNSTPERRDDGSTLWHGFLSDMTAHRATEAALRLRSAALEAAANAIVITDREGRIEWANPAFTQLSGWTVAEAVGRNPGEFIQSGEHDAAFYAQMWTTILAGKVWHGEIINRRKDGAIRTEEMTITPLRDEQGKLSHFIAIKHDITDQKAMETHFLHAQRMEAIGALAGGIAHDLNNILVPILMVTGMIRDELKEESSRELLAMAQSSAQRGAEIIKQLLTFSRGQEGERTLVQPRHLISEMLKMMRETFPREIDLGQDLPPDLWTVIADPTQLHQVLLNLCVNARDAMPEGGHLRLTAANVSLAEGDPRLPPPAKPGYYMVMEVSDTGHGIPADIRHRIFDPFFTTKPVGKGTGLGLSTVVGIVRNHGGFVTVVPRSPKGTTFSVFLPATPEGTEAAAATPTPPPSPADASVTVMVVDDERDGRDTLRMFLEQQRFQVITATHGEDAIGLFLQHRKRINVVLTDLMMPVMNGPTLIRTLRAIDPNVKIIAMSGLVDPAQLRHLATLGVTNLLMKPHDGVALLAAIHRELGDN